MVARLSKGRSLAEPRLTLHRTLDPLSADNKAKVTERLERWLQASIKRHLAPLAEIATAARDKATVPALRGLLAPVAEAGGIVARETVAASLPALNRDQRKVAANLGLKIGTLDLFGPALLKPEPMRWRLALLAARANATMPPVPAPGAAMIGMPDPLLRAAACRAGFRDLGDQMLRVDLVERLARHAHDAREGHRPFVPDPSLSTSLGLKPPAVARLMRMLGFARREGEAGAVAWLWRGRRPDRVDAPRLRPGNAFGDLARLLPPQAQGAHG